ISDLDLDKLTFPLTLRLWRNGDVFYPLGMDHRKKISDFLIDSKVNRIAKEKTMVLETAGEICWLVGHRIDERFKLSEDTEQIFRIQFESPGN
ncbi:MAG: tRNA lysidine(34) synthetase TilS, partial [Thiotrichales bacterium]|nr:tRNA lysidine(34) synthetase TilS [Thiotrichales bacterium]